MNKGITIVLLFVILGAMGLVFYLHSGGPAVVRQADLTAQVPAPVRLAETVETPASGLSSPSPSSLASPGTSGPLPLSAPQDGNTGLKQIDPPLTNRSGRSGQVGDGAPAPVRVTSANAGLPQSLPPVTPAVPETRQTPESSGASQSSFAAGSDAARQSPNSSPELAPWATPPADRTPAGAPESRSAAPDTRPQPPQPREETKPATPAKEPVLSDKAAHVLLSAGLHFSGQSMQLRLEADTPFPCRTFVLDNPHRLVIDLPGAWKGMQTPTLPQNRLVQKVRVGAQAAGPRIVLDLAGSPKSHKVQRNGNVVEIFVE